MEAEAGISATSFLVCGLGSLGQYCVRLLREFEVTINAIEAIAPPHWEIPDLPNWLNELVIGDCRQPKILEQANIHQCRAILLVTSDERVNIAAAFAARSLNPNIRLVIRSAQENLNELLSQQLGNFAAYEATQLPASAFALAALGDSTQGFFRLEGCLLRVVKEQISTGQRWCDRRQLYELNTSTRRVLNYAEHGASPIDAFYQWEPNARVRAGDTITYIEIAERLTNLAIAQEDGVRFRWQELIRNLAWKPLKHKLNQFWQNSNQMQRVGILSCIVMVSLLLAGAVLFKMQYSDINLQEAFNISLILALGGFDELFGGRQMPFQISWWLYLFSISMTVAGTIFIGILYAILTERVLAARFQFLKRRPPVPKTGHIVLIGLGRVGRRVADLLLELKHPLVGVSATAMPLEVPSEIPLVTGEIKDSLAKVNLAKAKSVVVLTDDEVANLEIGLMARAANPSCNLVLRTVDQRFAESVARLLPDARVLGAYALAAEAFVAATFGENILNLFRLNNRTTLVTEYIIEAGDTLEGRLLGEVAYGYGVVPILYQRSSYDSARLMPLDDIRLHRGDRLVVLATIEGLRRVEQGMALERHWLLRVEKAMSQEAAFEGAGAIARISGCDISLARTLMNQLPSILEVPLYKHQALRLVRELSKVQVSSHLVSDPGDGC
ncbi:MAG: NAD-binding protein [Leptolyngbyaceae cyanobacterium HOT.MB2.61]|nr:NAD-binding protein [Leptolyngbyaceae cyanobacterium HOT.MB2.61]